MTELRKTLAALERLERLVNRAEARRLAGPVRPGSRPALERGLRGPDPERSRRRPAVPLSERPSASLPGQDTAEPGLAEPAPSVLTRLLPWLGLLLCFAVSASGQLPGGSMP